MGILTWRSGCASKVIQASDHLEHRRQGYLAGLLPRESMWSCTMMNVTVKVPVGVDFVWIWEDFGFSVRADL